MKIMDVFLYCGLLLKLCVLCADASDPETPIVDAVAGEKAAIPCDVPTPLADDEASLILWYRVDLPNPIYTLDVRKVPMKGARHFPATEMEGRAHFDINVHPPVLVLTPVRLEDEAEYKCRVDLRRSRTLILLSRLNIIVPPSEPILMDEHGQRLRDVIGPYDEGTTVILICEVDGGDPSPEVTWWRGRLLLDDDFNVTTQGFVRNVLVLPNLQRSDLMVEFSCQASNTNLTKPKAATVRLDINLKPLEVKIQGVSGPFLSGKEHELTCETKGSRPRAITTWWLDGHKVGIGTAEATRDGGNLTVSVLHFTPTPEDNGKLLLCRSANPSLPKVIIEDDLIVKVHYIPIIHLSLGASISQSGIREGSDVYLECSVRANPWVSEVSWQFEDRPVVGNKSAGIIVSNQTLVLQRVKKEHRGRYKCLATNSVGQGSSEELNLLVQFAPVCKAPETRIYGIARTETVNVTCEVEADPSDVQFQWSLNSTATEPGVLQQWYSEGTKSVLSYVPKTKVGYGHLLCWGKNVIGGQKEPCVAKIVPAGAPDSPHDCVVTNQTSKSLAVECEPGYDGSLPQTFHLEIYNSVVEHMAANMTSSERPTFRIGGLPPGTSYVLVIYSSNKKGRSNSVALVASTLLPAERRTAEDDQAPVSPLIGILIGVIAVFVIAAIVIVVIVRTKSPKHSNAKESVTPDSMASCEISKKELEESQDASGKGPDIIPLAIESEVFFTGGFTDDTKHTKYLQNQESPSTELYVHQKYTDTVL